MAARDLVFVLLLSLLLVVSECYRYMGCYKEISEDHRQMQDLQKKFPGSLTPNVCIAFCSDNQFRYAGVQVGLECYCSRSRPSYIYLTDQADCNSACEGDRSQMCGGHWRLSVYDIRPNRVNYVQSNYVGCYADNGEGQRALTGRRVESDQMTPEYCAGYCYNYEYRYSGVQDRHLCFCGNHIKGERALEDDCDLDCTGDPSFLCGGHWRSNIYRVNSSHPDVTVTVLSKTDKCSYLIDVLD